MGSRLEPGQTVRLKGGDVDLKVHKADDHAVWLYNPKWPANVRMFDRDQVVA